MIQPTRRLRRLRNTPALRDLMRETRVHLDDLIYPIFIEEELDKKVPIASMPGVDRHPDERGELAVREDPEQVDDGGLVLRLGRGRRGRLRGRRIHGSRA